MQDHSGLIDQMELQLEELEAAATEDEIAAVKLTKTTTVAGFERRRPARKPFPGARRGQFNRSRARIRCALIRCGRSSIRLPRRVTPLSLTANESRTFRAQSSSSVLGRRA